ncbi:MFS transporter [Bacillus sp. H-16]|uniref:MFS transporter n=1 Tax=Alteribacter salitolerans TaxID=2912333 RepID=UPI0019662EAB|nr:MFS transporter [Alteribacter salitolerans]MBM7095221.1 MFS transporter [Alteribacter salitolerans]
MVKTNPPSIWTNKNYVKLFISYSISTLGQFFDMIAVFLIFSYVWQAEPWMIALIPVAYALPHAAFSQFAGILVDRYQKVTMMLTADLVTACLTVTLIFTANPWAALLVILVRSTATIVHFPAQQAIIRQVVAPDHILKAVTLNGTVNQLSKIIGPFLGASLAAAFAPQVSFAVYAGALLISAGILVRLRHLDSAGATVSEESPEPFWHTWRSGWQTLFTSKVMFVSFAFSLAAFTAIQLVDAQFGVLFRDIYPARQEVLGWAMAASGLGAVVIIMVMNRFRELKRYGLHLGTSVALIGAGFAGAGMLTPGIPLFWPVIACFAIGMGAGIFSVIYNYILQKESPEGKVGQMSGLFNSLTGMILLAAPIAGGLLVQWSSVFAVYQTVGLTVLTIGVFGIIFQRLLWGKPSNQERRDPDHTVEISSGAKKEEAGVSS